MFEKVATSLHQQAITLSDPTEKDLFSRSTFNRLYYSAFLATREVLKQLAPEWGEMAHKSIPEVLRGQITSHFSKGISVARRTSDPQTLKLCSSAKMAASELADLLEKAYKVRVTADYFPEIKVNYSDSSMYALNSVSINDARMWPNRAEAFARSVKSAWDQLK